MKFGGRSFFITLLLFPAGLLEQWKILEFIFEAFHWLPRVLFLGDAKNKMSSEAFNG